MSQTIKEVLDFVKDNDVKFVKLTFCDSFGNIKNISIVADELQDAFEKGVSFEATRRKAICCFIPKPQLFNCCLGDPSTEA